MRTTDQSIKKCYKLGWSFTPLNGKRPTLSRWQVRPRAKLEQCLAWASKRNIGVRTGSASGVVVIDVDPGADISALDLPDTVTAETGRGGLHLYFRHDKPLANSAGKLGSHIDVKADRGQVVFAGSVHPDTAKRYQWADGLSPWDVKLADLPAGISDQLSDKTSSEAVAEPQRDDKVAGRYGRAALDRELRAILETPEGARNNRLNQAGFSLGQLIAGGVLARDLVEAELRSTGQAVGLKVGEISTTVKSGIESGMKSPRYVKPREGKDLKQAIDRFKDKATEPRDILRPGAQVDPNGQYIEQTTAIFGRQCVEALSEHFPDLIYAKDTEPGQLISSKGTGKKIWSAVDKDDLRRIANTGLRIIEYIKPKKEDSTVEHYCGANYTMAGDIRSELRQSKLVRQLDLLVNYPVFGKNWERVKPGFHDGIYYDQPEDLKDLKPIRDPEEIHFTLEDLVQDFPFATQADKENFFGLLLTPMITPAIDGNRPLHLIGSPIERTGKSKLAEDVLGIIITGQTTPVMQLTDRDDERDKRILSILMQGGTILHLDNLPAKIDSAVLSSLLTASKYSGRVLGSSRIVSLDNVLSMVGTGNNVQASGEIAKRTVPIMLNPKMAHPEYRTKFAHPDLRAYVRSERRRILSCLVGMIENWRDSRGKGREVKPKPMGGFEAWAKTVGEILACNAFTRWRANESDWREDADQAGTELESFVALWESQHGSEAVSPSSLLDLAKGEDYFIDIRDRRSENAVASAWGKMLTKLVNRPVGSWIIRKSGKVHRPFYSLETIR